MTRTEQIRKRLPVWPSSKPIPNFKTAEDEDRFWTSYEFEDGVDTDWEEIDGPVPPRPA